MLETFHRFRGEAFGLILEDLARLPRRTPVVVVGFGLLPHLMEPLLTEPRHAVWPLPTPEFRQVAFGSRALPEGTFTRKSDPERADRDIALRDTMYTRRLHEETARLRLPAITVDGTMTEGELAERVSEVFRL
ncbi:hypothetical protein [Streptomyces sp. NPDC093598]|uniref:hypothetical protein n=1 Tax=Streptomyces sp. NPDC093598 TaxID=3366046 RepID=UPI0038271028